MYRNAFPSFLDDADEIRPLRLSELNNLVRGVLEQTLDEAYWIVAEVSEMRVAANGHCYLEFVEKDASGTKFIAKARANIWRSTYDLLAPWFEQSTGHRLQAGLKVLVRVTATFHEVYGFSLNVIDIDPNYTLGDMERRRREILAQLREDGVLTLNKELELPRLTKRIAVISAATAAGYGDFCRQLEQSGFLFTTRLFPAAMQGEKVEESVINALDAVAGEQADWDAVVIIRGGGAVSELSSFDSYLLAANVAQFPLPVLTGIGHERDDTVTDSVAHCKFKTPTAVAAFLIERRKDEWDLFSELSERLQEAVEQAISERKSHLNALASRLHLIAVRYASKRAGHIAHLEARAELLARQRVKAEWQRIIPLQTRLTPAAKAFISKKKEALNHADRAITLASPERILKMGFSITTSGGRIVRNAATLKAGDRLATQFADGTIESIVTSPTDKP
ncbi:MAG: exodeoxyribonuclease VII large subunit [Alloprevotella sp.]